MSNVSLEKCSLGRSSRVLYGRKNEEYMADFLLVSKRTLDPFSHKLFRYHYLLGADWKMCCRVLGIDRGNFFHHAYRVEQRLGRVYAELRPYALFPLDEYFGGTIHDDRVRPFAAPVQAEVVNIGGHAQRKGRAVLAPIYGQQAA